MDIEIGGETFHKEANLLEQIAYRDTWGVVAVKVIDIFGNDTMTLVPLTVG